MVTPYTPNNLYSKISYPTVNILDSLASVARELSWDLSSITSSIFGTVAASRVPAKPFIIGFIPPDITVNFTPVQQSSVALQSTITANNASVNAANNAANSGRVPLRPTPLSQSQALGTLLAAGCPQSALLIVAAQSAVETAGFGSVSGQGLNNWNFGNLTPTPNQLANGQYFTVNFGGGHTGNFVSYSDPVSGASAMVNHLQNNGTLAAAGDINSYMARLQATGYLGFVGQIDQSGNPVTQASYDKYQAGIQQWINNLQNVTPSNPPNVNATPAEFGGNTINPAVIPSSSTTSVVTTSVMTNANITDQDSQDPLSQQLGRNLTVANQTRLAAAQQQTKYLNYQITLVQSIPALMMLVNPSEFTRNYEQTTDPVKTRSGYVINMWLEKPISISAKGVTAGQYVFQSDGSGGISSLNRIQSVSYQNLMSLVGMFKNNGNIFTDTSFGDGNTGIPLISMSLYIYYDNHIYIGSFDDFEITDDGEKPFNLSYSWKFTVRYDIDTSQISDSFISSFGLPASGFIPAGSAPPGIVNPNAGQVSNNS